MVCLPPLVSLLLTLNALEQPDTTKCSTADKPADCNYPNCACGDPPKNQVRLLSLAWNSRAD